MINVAYFGHDSADAAIRRRIEALQMDGVSVTGFMMHRRKTDVDWDNVDLGETSDAAYLQRIKSIFTGAAVACASPEKLRDADIIIARNLDMLATAFETKRRMKLDTPVIYECLDIHRLLSGTGAKSAALRRIEGLLLRRCAGLIVSSPAFLTHHFEKYYPGQYQSYLLENRLSASANYGVRIHASSEPDQPIKLGWVGMLRCDRSLHALAGAADRLGSKIEIHLHGIPARTEIPVFEPIIDARENMYFWGRYKAPENLSEIYSRLDLVWAGDYMEAGQNSVWLLPNRIYEGGYFLTPSIAPSGTETAAWLKRQNCGFEIDEPIEDTLVAKLEQLIADRGPIHQKMSALHSLDDSVFIQPHGTLIDILTECLQRAG